MPRPPRIEFPGAWYQVTNEAVGRRLIFRADEHYEVFLQLLHVLSERFAIQTHAYCLMGNHYQLLLHTPRAGLGRGMRHLDGVYTQQFNRLTRTDGPLFRGRYKATLIDADNYLPQVSRHIHRDPLQARMTGRLVDYRWSSYPAYLSRRLRPAWLHCESVLDATTGGLSAYRHFVESAIEDDELARFHARGRKASLLGSEKFRAKVERHARTGVAETAQARRVRAAVPLARIVAVVGAAFGIKPRRLLSGERPSGEVTLARDVALWRGQVEGQLSLSALAEAFGLGHYTSVATAIGRARKSADEDRLMRERVEVIEGVLDRNKH